MVRFGRLRHWGWAWLWLQATASAAALAAEPLVFLGDKDLRPYEFLESGQPRGASVELAQAIGRELGRPVEIRLMNWEQAQALFLAGEGHALTLLTSTAERERQYRFSQPTLPVAFSLFVRAEDTHRFPGDSLQGKVVGVTEGGFARLHLQSEHPEATYVTVDNLLDGTQRLVRREIDALGAQEWSEYHLLNELGIRGVVGLDSFMRTQSSVAVRRSDAALMAQIDQALGRIRATGEFDRILDRWSHTRVHLVSQTMVTTVGLVSLALALGLVLLVAALLWQRRQKRAMAHEVEQRRVVERRLRGREDELQRADAAKDLFLATLAHELRNPLAPILHASRLIELQAGASPGVRAAQGVISRQARHLSRLVDDLLDVGRITSGKVGLRRAPVLLSAVVDDSLEACRHLIDASGHRLTLQVPEAWIDGDRVRLAQVLTNLLTNAVKYHAGPGRVDVQGHVDGGFLWLTVRDEGVGIAAAELESVFRMFHREVRLDGREVDGLGIGLWLSRQLVELHDGTLQAYSEGEGRGSEFRLRLPVTSPPAADAPVAAATPSVTPRRVLLVDDNIEASEMLALLLSGSGHTVAIEHGGLAALAKAEAWCPEVIFLDIGLPDLSGHEVCRRIRSAPWSAAPVIVAMTGWGADADREKSGQAGFDGHLTKPTDIAVLESWLVPRPAPGAGG